MWWTTSKDPQNDDGPIPKNKSGPKGFNIARLFGLSIGFSAASVAEFALALGSRIPVKSIPPPGCRLHGDPLNSIAKP